MRISLSEKLRRDVDFQRRRLPKISALIVERPRAIRLRRRYPVKFKFCKGYTQPGLFDANPNYILQRGQCQEMRLSATDARMRS